MSKKKTKCYEVVVSATMVVFVKDAINAEQAQGFAREKAKDCGFSDFEMTVEELVDEVDIDRSRRHADTVSAP